MELQIISRQEGYDYEFLPTLDSKYECSICLLALRAPYQTTCGHRFCRNCIFNCISEGKCHCPLDNKVLTENDMFPDSCVEREILQLRVKCPNYTLGCSRTVDLNYVDAHTQGCDYQPVICPNECAATVLQKELEHHLLSQCILRLTKCQLCEQPCAFDQEQVHLLTCVYVSVACELCSAMMPRGNVGKHMTTTCPKVVVACTFVEHGCQEKMNRSNLDEHMTQAVQHHIQLLSSAYKKINTFVSDLSRTVGLFQGSGNFSRQPSLRSHASTSSPIAEHQICPNFDVLSIHCDRTLEKGVGFNEEFNGGESAFGAVGGIDAYDLGKDNHNESSSKTDDKAQSQTQMILKDLSEKSVNLDQRMLEETIRLNNLSKRIEEIDRRVEDSLADFNGRFCNGEFVWKIPQYSNECYEQRQRPGLLVKHSPSFYTSQFGYKFCIRTNVTRKNYENFLSLYIHMMQGENDCFLDWPFHGQITLSVLDISNSPKKNHATEIMASKPGLEAFNRSPDVRNMKGFGFTEFLNLSKILDPESCYLRNDTLFIKAIVKVGSQLVKEC